MKPAPYKSSSPSRSLLIVIVFALGVLAFNAATMGATLKSETTVRDEMVTLADVLEDAGEHGGIVLIAAPAPGERGQIALSIIKSAALKVGLVIENPSNFSRVFVTREGAPLMEEDLTLILKSAFKDRSLVAGDFTLTLHGLYKNIALPVGLGSEHVEVASLTLDRRTSRFRATLMVPVSADANRRFDISGQLTELQLVPVLAQPVEKGRILTSADIDWLSMPVKRLSATTAKSAESLVGMEARRSLKAGTPLRLSDLQRPLLVRKGALVAMQLVSGNLSIIAVGKALEAGGEGDYIRLLNTTSKQSVEGLVVGPNRVSVQAVGAILFARN